MGLFQNDRDTSLHLVQQHKKCVVEASVVRMIEFIECRLFCTSVAVFFGFVVMCYRLPEELFCVVLHGQWYELFTTFPAFY